jgi:hypothetical protein
MKEMKIYRHLCLVMLACSCAPLQQSDPPVYLPDIQFPNISNYTVGAWVNIHSNRSDLVGVHVQQFPDCACKIESKPHEGKHPAMVIYVFQSKTAHQVEYKPDGSISSGFWWDVEEDHWLWENLDRLPLKQ